jgi:hypothetical protein
VALARRWNGCVDHDPTGQILSAWIAKEELRATAASGKHRADIPELTTLAETIETWWPAIEVFLTTGSRTPAPRASHREVVEVS